MAPLNVATKPPRLSLRRGRPIARPESRQALRLVRRPRPGRTIAALRHGPHSRRRAVLVCRMAGRLQGRQRPVAYGWPRRHCTNWSLTARCRGPSRSLSADPSRPSPRLDTDGPRLSGVGKQGPCSRRGPCRLSRGIQATAKRSYGLRFGSASTKRHNLVVCVASFETRPKPHLGRALRTLDSGTLERDMTEVIRSGQADAWIEDHYLFLQHPAQRPTLEWFLDMAEVAVVRHGARIVQIIPGIVWKRRAVGMKQKQNTSAAAFARCTPLRAI